MYKVVIPGLVAAAVLALVLTAEPPEDGAIFHVILADPGMYPDGTFTGSFEAGAGEYVFRFVPSGSSPETLTITLSGTFEVSRDFVLVGTRAETAEYYTWRYDGDHSITIPEAQEVSIAIDPNGDISGAVSVYIE